MGNKVVSIAIYVLLTVILVFSGSLVLPVYKKYRATQQEVAELNELLSRRRSECLALREEIHNLEHKSSAIERVAREKFHYSREGEIVYLYSE
ncbi:MAG: septum formation initiator family protein [Lentisphaeria bacterium]|nr:septum formation initiator family protein [Lentisphaeria bacterium]